jgi:transcription elongation factor GreB
VSKAFTREDETADEDPPNTQDPAAGAKNYITPRGFQRLRDELTTLLRVERPKTVDIVSWAAGNGDRSENGDYIYGKRRLREIDRRIRFLTKRMEAAEIVDPAAQKNREQVFFGARVTYVGADDIERTIRIVGIDEADSDHGEVSWISPIARALLKARVGDVIDLRAPGGIETIEIVAIDYPDQ